MNICKICKKTIDEKYETCYSCLETYKKQNTSHLTTFTCVECGVTMHSMKWEGDLCCNCYNHSKSIKKNKMCTIKGFKIPTIENNSL